MRRVWTDGACRGNPGPGGWAWATADGPWASGCEAQSTNQRMEIKAALEAVRAIEEPLTVVSDSTYVVNCFRDRWWEGWLKRGWINSQKKAVANRDLWEPLIQLYRARGDVTFEWVKGHSGDVMNDLVDRLAVAAADEQHERSGDSPPTVLGPADEPGAAPVAVGRDARLPPGHLIGIFGHRPPELGGYDDNPVSDAVRSRLARILEAKRALHRSVTAVTGLRLGAEMLGAEAALLAGVPFVAILPFPDPDLKWPRATRERFRRLVDSALGTVVLEKVVPPTPQRVAASLRRRDAWMARHLDEAIVVWDGVDRQIQPLVRTLQEQLGDDVWEEPVPPAP